MASQADLLLQWREFFDQQLFAIGVRAPMPSLNQSSNDYAREVCRSLKRRYLPRNHEFARINFRGLEADALQRLAPQLIEHVKVEAVNPENLPPGEIRAVERLDPHTGQVRFRDWVGQKSFVADPAYGFRPGRRVTSFATDRGKYDAVKARWC